LIAVAIGAQLASAAPGVQILQNDNGWRPQWALDRVDQHGAVLDDHYHCDRAGRGVSVYVFDSGINSAHEDLTGRTDPGFNVVLDDNETEDCSGHGTHSASLIGGTSYGIAKEARLIPVRVLNCRNAQSSSATLYPAIDWIIEHHQPGVPAVVNLSVGMPKSEAFNEAVRRLIADGLVVVAAAGNQNRDACSYSPASESSAIVVGATDRAELRAWYSNYGSCVDLFAPRSDVVAAWFGAPNTYRSSSGTSNAAPIVSGIVALMLEAEPALTQVEVEQRLISNATRDALSNIGANSPNLLAYSVFGMPVDSPTTTVPTPGSTTTTVPPSTTVPVPGSRSFPLPADLTCTTPAARIRSHNVPYVCVNTGDRLMWIPQRYSPARP
jgi:subtilisin family serine protease